MKTYLVLAFAILSVGIVLTLLKLFSAPQANGLPTERAARQLTAESSQESAAKETIAPRNAPAQPQDQTPAATVTADLLGRIQWALASANLDDREIVFTDLLAELVRTDPLAAARFAETNSMGYTHDQVLQHVAQLWAATDSAAALDWAATLSNPAERDAILTEVCLQVAESDPAEAVPMLSHGVPDEIPNGGLEAVMERWAEKDFPAALDWALSRAASEQRDLLIARVAYVKSQTSPLEAATLVVEKIPAGEAQIEAAISVLHQWASHDMAAAGQWAARFPEGDLRSRAFSELGNIARIQTPGELR
jgi:hypothetical protein